MRGALDDLTRTAAIHSSHPFRGSRLLNELPAFTATLHAFAACDVEHKIAGEEVADAGNQNRAGRRRQPPERHASRRADVEYNPGA
jgi:hypothetical protein